MTIKHILLVFISILSFTNWATAQDPCDDYDVVFSFGAPYTADSSPITPGKDFCIDVLVRNFDQVNTFQFVLSFNPRILELLSNQMNMQVIPELGTSNFTMNSDADNIGYIKFIWVEGSGQSISIPDQMIFKLSFKATGNPDDCTLLNLVTNPVSGPVPIIGFSTDITLPTISCDLVFEPIKIAIQCDDFFGNTVSCNSADGMGSLNLNVCGGLLPYNYSINGLNTGFSSGGIFSSSNDVVELTGLLSDTYEIEVTDQNGTQYTQSIVIGNSPPLSFDLNVTAPVNCPGLSGDLEISNIEGGSGDIADYSIEWSNGTFNLNSVNVSEGDYSVTVTDVNGCSAVEQISLFADSIEIININIDSSSCGGDDGFLSFDIVGGQPDLAGNYEIKINNQPIAPNSSFSGQVNAGINYIWVRDGIGCPIVDTLEIYIPTRGKLEVDIETTDVLCFGDSTGSVRITLSERVGFNPNLSCRPNAILDSPCGDVLTDQNGVEIPGFVSTDNLGYNNVLWPRTYYVTLVSESLCRLDTFFTIGEPTLLTAIKDSINPECSADGGSVTITPNGGVGPYMYSWDFDPTVTDSMVDGLSEGMYNVIVTDLNNCSLEASFNLEGGGMLTPVIDIIQQVNCDSTVLGITEVSLQSGGTNFQADWFDIGGTLIGVQPRLENIFPGMYYVQVTDNDSGCMGSDTFEITKAARFIFDSTVTNATCFGGSDGVINIEEPTGGQSPYTYNWEEFGPIGPFVASLDTGFYDVKISDITGCSFDTTFHVTAPTQVMGDVTLEPSQCYGECNGVATAIPSGGTITTDNYSYLWDNGETTEMVNNLCPGVHYVTIYDELGCESEEIPFRIEQPDSLQVAPVSVSSPSCADDSTGIILVEAGGGLPGYIYDWGLNFPQDSVLFDLPSGTYEVTVTDENLCTATSEFTLTSAEPVLGEPVITNPVECFGGTTCVFIDNLSGGSSGQYVYSITLADGTIPVDSCFEVIGGFEYTINVFDAVSGFLCSYETTILIDQPDQFTVNLGDDREMILGDSTIFINAIVNGGVGIDTIIWSEDVDNGPNSIICADEDCTTINILPNNTTVYTATVIDENGCETSSTVLVELNKERKVYRPNIFNPDSFRGNNKFMIFIGSGAEEIEEFGIYDRWGNQVFFLEDVKKEDITPDIGWDGRFNNREAPIGVYVYYAKILFPDQDEPILYKGDLTLVR